MKKKESLKNNYILYISFILIIVASLLYINTSKKIEETVEDNSIYSYITPTIVPSTKKSWNTFLHPGGDFNFDYPSDWNITVQKHKNAENWYDVMLSGKFSESDFRIYFQINGRDYPNYEEKKVEKIIGNRKVIWTTLSRNSIPVEEFISFPNNDLENKLLSLYIYMPANNQEEFNKIIEEIIGSLK